MALPHHPAIESLAKRLNALSGLPEAQQGKAYEAIVKQVNDTHDTLLGNMLHEQVRLLKDEDIDRLHDLEIQRAVLNIVDPDNPTAIAKIKKAIAGETPTGDSFVSTQFRRARDSVTQKDESKPAEKFVVVVDHRGPRV
jgi:hypothetical protein